jgi:hypothetical protein
MHFINPRRNGRDAAAGCLGATLGQGGDLDALIAVLGPDCQSPDLSPTKTAPLRTPSKLSSKTEKGSQHRITNGATAPATWPDCFDVQLSKPLLENIPDADDAHELIAVLDRYMANTQGSAYHAFNLRRRSILPKTLTEKQEPSKPMSILAGLLYG